MGVCHVETSQKTKLKSNSSRLAVSKPAWHHARLGFNCCSKACVPTSCWLEPFITVINWSKQLPGTAEEGYAEGRRTCCCVICYVRCCLGGDTCVSRIETFLCMHFSRCRACFSATYIGVIQTVPRLLLHAYCCFATSYAGVACCSDR